jgi:hypothetical protein
MQMHKEEKRLINLVMVEDNLGFPKHPNNARV